MHFFTLDLRRGAPLMRGLRVLALLLVLLLAGQFLLSHGTQALLDGAGASPSVGRVVILDAGHGGEDGGAVGASGVAEKDLNLAVTLALGEALSESGHTVLYTRTDDRLLYTPEEDVKGLRKISDLKNRCKIAAEYQDALFISIHMNSFGKAKYAGTQVYYSTLTEESRRLAASIRDAVREEVQPDNTRVTKEGEGIYLLEHVENVAVLVECGFLSNPEECARLSDAEYQRKLASAIASGILAYEESLTSE